MHKLKCIRFFTQICFEYLTAEGQRIFTAATQNWSLLIVTLFACQVFSDQQSNIFYLPGFKQ
jgi:hypothetical protein